MAARGPLRARALVAGTIGLGAGTLALAAIGAAAPISTLALLAAAVLITELFQVESDQSSPDPADAHVFSCSSGVHIAAVLIVGPFVAALVAAFGVLVVDGARRVPPLKVLFNASVFAVAALAAGFAFQALGGDPGRLELPGDLLPIAGLAFTYTAVDTLLVGLVVALTSRTAARPIILGHLGGELPTLAAEVGFGCVLAYLVLSNPWLIAALVPLLVAVYQANARLVRMRRETAHALETFANLVDERDPYTYRHSARVAEYLHELGQALALPSADVARLRSAGRLHDLGKIAVDAGILRKGGKLDAEEWRSMRRHPRLSARLLGRFGYATGEARAVEYHHERFDGLGYYGIDPARVPLASHFLVVADTFDAMTTDRPYRPGLSKAEALAEIERNLGTQFHPAVGKAFVACQRGLDPGAALTRAELAELQTLSFGGRSRLRDALVHLPPAPELVALGALVASLVLVGAGLVEAAAPAFGATLAALAWRRVRHARALRLAAELRRAVAGLSRSAAFAAVCEHLARAGDLQWAGVFEWSEHGLAGALDQEWGSPFSGPPETALVSWLIREADSDAEVLRASATEFGRDGVYLALALRRGRVATSFAVCSFKVEPAAHVDEALRLAATDLSASLATPESLQKSSTLAAAG